MRLLLLYWNFLAIGYLLASYLAKREIKFTWIQMAMMGSIYFLCFIMGLRMGVNEQVTSNLGSIGLMSFIITVLCIAGSMGAIFAMRKLLNVDRYGNVRKIKGSLQETGNATSDEDNYNKDDPIDLKSTLTIFITVAGGMIIGAFVMAKSDILAQFDVASYYALVVFLCVLLFFVGFDLGATGTVFTSLKSTGFRIVVFPVAAVLGTIIVGTAVCLIMNFSIRESLAICMGFGWYTYAPIVITGAGEEYMIAGAVSFMHNVIREVAGIVFIPVLAKKIGYLESTGVPGVAAMDVCIPIVKHSCKSDTVMYSFATGLLMCLVTSIGVPLVMGL